MTWEEDAQDLMMQKTEEYGERCPKDHRDKEEEREPGQDTYNNMKYETQSPSPSCQGKKAVLNCLYYYVGMNGIQIDTIKYMAQNVMKL